MTTDLYSFANVDRSARVRWLLHELGQPVAEHRLDYEAQEQQGAKFRAISPFGLVPGAKLDGDPVFDSGAIMLAILETVPNDIAPAVGESKRASFLSWMFAGTASLDPTIIDLFFALRDESTHEAVVSRLRERAQKRLAVLENELAERRFVLGDEFSACDIVIGHLLGAMQRAGQLEPYPALRDYLRRLMLRPAAKNAGLFEGIELQ